MFSIFLYLAVGTLDILVCQVKNLQCIDLVASDYAFVTVFPLFSRRGITQGVLLLMAYVLLFQLFQITRDFKLQLRPERYRAYMRGRIDRLRARA
jgi:hypothetical protein